MTVGQTYCERDEYYLFKIEYFGNLQAEWMISYFKIPLIKKDKHYIIFPDIMMGQ